MFAVEALEAATSNWCLALELLKAKGCVKKVPTDEHLQGLGGEQAVVLVSAAFRGPIQGLADKRRHEAGAHSHILHTQLTPRNV